MREDEPLEKWLFIAALPPAPELEQRGRQNLRESLALLEALVASPADKKQGSSSERFYGFSAYRGVWLLPDERARAQRLYYQVWERGGAGSTFIQEQLLQQIALTLDAEAIPFWVALLDLTKPRDQFTTRRRTFALAALAFLALRTGNEEAYTSLAAALNHAHEQVRALAAFYLAPAYRVAKRPLPDTTHSALLNCATHDPAFGPRFQARAALRRLGLPVPLDNPDGAYHFQVRLSWDRTRASRTIALRSDDTLDDLHFAIQHAFNWGADHLFAFYMNNQRHDQRYQIRCPELDADGWTVLTWQGAASPLSADIADDEHDEAGDDGELYTSEVLIGALGLVPKHTFMYFFDFGDNHEFAVTVVAIEAQATPGDYPRLIASKGQAPQQYPSYEDEDDEGDEEDDEGDEKEA